jgi:crotonobetainyl-CoA:carnitine CoA-transferase CaiB-like acyl-CoA transferase
LTESPLQGLRVADFTQGAAGPYCAMLLGDYGADVIKVEPPRGDWGRTMGTSVGPDNGTTYLSVNRNKRSLCLDMKDDRGRAVAARLAGRSDIVVESFRPGVMDRLGLGYETLAADNPRLIYCSISGYGQDGPNAGLPAGDSTMQAYGGLMSVIGEPGRQPLRVGNVVSDMLTGMNAFQGVMMALLTLEKTGKGRRVALNLMDSLMAFLAPPLTEYMVTGNLPDRIGNAHPLLGPSGAMQTADGHIVVTVLDHQWPAFCERLGIEAAQADRADQRLHGAQGRPSGPPQPNPRQRGSPDARPDPDGPQPSADRRYRDGL